MDDVRLQLRDAAVEWRRVDDEVVALHLETSMYLAINASGRLLWERLADGGATRAELIAHLRADFGLDADRAAADVDAFLAGLREQQLLAEPAA
jgi:predicted Rdx family selenoprotein